MKTINWTNQKRKVKDLIPAEYNPRKISDKEKADLEYSLQTWGYVVPVQINTGSRENVLIGGHQRVMILAALGRLEEEIDVRVPDRELTLEEEKELNVSLNRMGGQFDWTKLFKNFDVDTLLRSGFNDDELNKLWDNVDLIDDLVRNGNPKEPEEEVVPRMTKGDVFKLGKHRVMNGDPNSVENFEILMGEEKADILWADPFMAKLNVEEVDKLLDGAVGAAEAFMKEDAHFFVWGDERTIGMTQRFYEDRGIENKRVCLWINNDFPIDPKVAFSKVYVPCIYGTTGKPYIDRRFSKINEVLNANVESGNAVEDEILDMLNIWLADRKSKEEVENHKPMQILQKPLRRCTAPNHILLDPFGRSGMALMACDQMGRQARVMEKDPVQCEIILRRWEKFTGLKAEKI